MGANSSSIPSCTISFSLRTNACQPLASYPNISNIAIHIFVLDTTHTPSLQLPSQTVTMKTQQRQCRRVDEEAEKVLTEWNDMNTLEFRKICQATTATHASLSSSRAPAPTLALAPTGSIYLTAALMLVSVLVPCKIYALLQNWYVTNVH